MLPPGTSHYRAVVTDTRQQQRRSFAAGPFITPPAVTSELASTGSVGKPFAYSATATGPLTGFSATGLPPWATAVYDPASEMLTIIGTPTTAGPTAVTLRAANIAGTGSATLNLLVTAAFSDWRTANFTADELNNPMISGPLGDATGSGIANLIRYALGIPAKRAGSAGLPTGSVRQIGASRYLVLTYTRDRSATDATIAVQVSGDLATWSSSAASITELSRTINPDGSETVVTRDNTEIASSTRRHIRLQIKQ